MKVQIDFYEIPSEAFSDSPKAFSLSLPSECNFLCKGVQNTKTEYGESLGLFYVVPEEQEDMVEVSFICIPTGSSFPLEGIYRYCCSFSSHHVFHIELESDLQRESEDEDEQLEQITEFEPYDDNESDY